MGKLNYLFKLFVVKRLIFVLTATDEGIKFIGEDYCCTVCNKTFGLKCNAKRHVRKFHPNPSDATQSAENDQDVTGTVITTWLTILYAKLLKT